MKKIPVSTIKKVTIPLTIIVLGSITVSVIRGVSTIDYKKHANSDVSQKFILL